MAVTVTHSYVVTLPDNPAFPVSRNEWNENHVIVGAAASGGNSDITSLDALVGTATQPPITIQPSVLTTVLVPGSIEYADGHFYVTNGTRHAVTNCAGVKTTTTTVVNTAVETVLYSYNFSANELHQDEKITFNMSGVYSNASASDDFTIRVKVAGVTLHTITRVGGNQTNAGWQIFYEGTIRTDGVSGTFVDFVKLLDNESVYMQADTTTHSINTTGTVLFEATIQWANAKAGNTFSCTQGSLMFEH